MINFQFQISRFGKTRLRNEFLLRPLGQFVWTNGTGSEVIGSVKLIFNFMSEVTFETGNAVILVKLSDLIRGSEANCLGLALSRYLSNFKIFILVALQVNDLFHLFLFENLRLDLDFLLLQLLQNVVLLFLVGQNFNLIVFLAD